MRHREIQERAAELLLAVVSCIDFQKVQAIHKWDRATSALINAAGAPDYPRMVEVLLQKMQVETVFPDHIQPILDVEAFVEHLGFEAFRAECEGAPRVVVARARVLERDRREAPTGAEEA